MDAICKSVFEKVLSACKGGGYAIIDSGEFIDAITDGERKAVGEIDGALKTLQKNGFIDLKYARGNVYCVAALKNSLPEERKPLPEPPTTVIELKEKPNKKLFALYSVASFLGGALGSALVLAVAAII